MPPYPPRSSAFSVSTCTVSPAARPASAARSANTAGGRSFGAVFTRSRARATASAATVARRTASREARSARSVTSATEPTAGSAGAL
jgi:hypothetical protein